MDREVQEQPLSALAEAGIRGRAARTRQCKRRRVPGRRGPGELFRTRGCRLHPAAYGLSPAVSTPTAYAARSSLHQGGGTPAAPPWASRPRPAASPPRQPVRAPLQRLAPPPPADSAHAGTVRVVPFGRGFSFRPACPVFFMAARGGYTSATRSSVRASRQRSPGSARSGDRRFPRSGGQPRQA